MIIKVKNITIGNRHYTKSETSIFKLSNLKDYIGIKQNFQFKLGGIGPDFNNGELKKKMEKYEKINQFSAEVLIYNQIKLKKSSNLSRRSKKLEKRDLNVLKMKEFSQNVKMKNYKSINLQPINEI